MYIAPKPHMRGKTPWTICPSERRAASRRQLGRMSAKFRIEVKSLRSRTGCHYVPFNRPPGLFKLFSKNVLIRLPSQPLHHSPLLCLPRFIYPVPPPFQPVSLVSRSQAKTLMELFHRTISHANSAFFIGHWPFGLL